MYRSLQLTLIPMLLIAGVVGQSTTPARTQSAPAQGKAPAAATEQEFGRASAADTDVKRSEIRKLIELTGAAKVSASALKQIIAPMRQAFPQVPEGFWNEFLSEVRADELVDLIVPIYDKYYTRDDIQELTRFYQSPVGQKTVKVLPQLSAEAIDAGQTWGREVADRAMKKLQQKGYDKTSSAPAALPSDGK
jgi:hypothetical protein